MIRRAQKSDRDAVAEMWTALLTEQGELDGRFAPSEDARERWENDFPEWLNSLSRRIFVAVTEEQPCGFITAEQWTPPPVYNDRPGVYVSELYVRPEHRRAGFGVALVDAVREWAEEVGASQIRAGVLARNEDGAAFWQHVGAEPIARTFAFVVDGREEENASGRRIGFSL